MKKPIVFLLGIVLGSASYVSAAVPNNYNYWKETVEQVERVDGYQEAYSMQLTFPAVNPEWAVHYDGVAAAKPVNGYIGTWLGELQRILGLEKEDPQISGGISRGTAKENSVLFPCPGYYATLLADETVVFTWGNKPVKTVTFFDDKGREVGRKEVAGAYGITLTAKEMGLRQGNFYSWKIDDSFYSYRLKILREDTVSELKKQLAEFDNEAGTDGEKTIKKAAYLQLISDMYPGKLDLYWLSYQLLEELPDASAADAGVVQMKKRCKRHLDEQM